MVKSASFKVVLSNRSDRSARNKAKICSQIAFKFPNTLLHRKFCFIPIGYIQAYLVRDYLDFAEITEVADGASIDLYIAETAFIQRGLGWLIELKFLQEILFPIFSTQKCYVCHEKANIPALKTSNKAGFRYVRDVVEDGKLSELLATSKQEVGRRIDYLLSQK